MFVWQFVIDTALLTISYGELVPSLQTSLMAPKGDNCLTDGGKQGNVISITHVGVECNLEGTYEKKCI